MELSWMMMINGNIMEICFDISLNLMECNVFSILKSHLGNYSQ